MSPIRLKGSSVADLEKLLLSAITVVLRRDMSLNRRLYIWLLGSDEHSNYFPRFALQPLINALKKLLTAQDSLQPDPIRVSKISLALLDKWEVGGHVVPALFTPVMETVFSRPDSNVLSSARALFDSMDPAVIWAELFLWIELKKIDLLLWVVDRFNLREEEMLVRHIPQILLYVLYLMQTDRLEDEGWFELARKLIGLLPSRAFTNGKGVDIGENALDGTVESFVSHYYRDIRKNIGTEAPLAESVRGTSFHKYLLSIFNTKKSTHEQEWAALLKEAAAIIPCMKRFGLSSVLDHLNEKLQQNGDFRFLGTAIETAISLEQHRHIEKNTLGGVSSEEYKSSIASTFIHLLWRNLAPDRASHHVEAVSYIWSLTVPLSANLVESLLAREIESASTAEDDKAASCSKFTVLWKHAVDRSGTAAVLTMPMMLILRFLKGEEGAPGRSGVERWLAELGNSAHRMFDIIFSKLLEDKLLRPPIEKEYKDIMVVVTPVVPDSDELSTFSYHLDLLLGIFRSGNQSLRSVCADDRAVLDPSRLELLEKSTRSSDFAN